MLVPLLIAVIIILGAIVVYFGIVVPRINPSQRAVKFQESGQYEEAINEYKKVLEANPRDFVVHYKLALIYLAQNKIDPAALHLEEVMKIDKYNNEVEKVEVLRRLAKIYHVRDEQESAFQTYFDILKYYPSDEEALYQVAFMILGQEYFDMADRYFERLIKTGRKNFEILFSAGMAAYQNQRTAEAVTYFKEALSIEPHSDIANLAMAFALYRKRDLKTAINYAKMIMDTSSDQAAVLIARRLYAFLNVQVKRPDEALKRFEQILEYSRQQNLKDEQAMALYDLGFACVNAERTSQAYEYWNELYQLDRNYRDVQRLVMTLRREMDTEARQMGSVVEESVVDRISLWIKDAFPDDFIWRICGLKSRVALDLSQIITTARTGAVKQGLNEALTDVSGDSADIIERLYALDQENFRIIANRVTSKLGYSVIEILPTYRESDGVDFMVRSKETKEQVLVWVRRWKGVQIGEIPLRNFAQAVNDVKAKAGIFITTTPLTSPAEDTLKRLSKIKVVLPDQLSSLLSGLV